MVHKGLLCWLTSVLCISINISMQNKHMCVCVCVCVCVRVCDQSSSALVYIMTLCRTWAARSNSLSFQLFIEWMKWIYLRKWVSGEGQQLDSQNQHIFVRMFVISQCPPSPPPVSPPPIPSSRVVSPHSVAGLGVSYGRGNGVAGSAFQVEFVLWNCVNMLFFVLCAVLFLGRG